MKIESKGIEITEIPVFHSIVVTPDQITLIGGGFDSREKPMTHHLFRVEALALRDALNAALDAQIKMPGAEMVTDALGVRAFAENDAEPGPEITKLIDRDGTYWYRVRDGWGLERSGHGIPWDAVVEYVPLTEVRDA